MALRRALANLRAGSPAEAAAALLGDLLREQPDSTCVGASPTGQESRSE